MSKRTTISYFPLWISCTTRKMQTQTRGWGYSGVPCQFALSTPPNPTLNTNKRYKWGKSSTFSNTGRTRVPPEPALSAPESPALHQEAKGRQQKQGHLELSQILINRTPALQLDYWIINHCHKKNSGCHQPKVTAAARRNGMACDCPTHPFVSGSSGRSGGCVPPVVELPGPQPGRWEHKMEPSARPSLWASRCASPRAAATSCPWAAGSMQGAAGRCAQHRVALPLLPSKTWLPAKHRVPLSGTWNSNSYTESRQSWLHCSAASDQTRKAFVM